MSFDIEDWDVWWTDERMKCIIEGFENLGNVVAFGASRYAKGFSDATLLREFCEDYTPEPYFPIADNRPKADRLKWEYCKHMLGEKEGSCARCEGT